MVRNCAELGENLQKIVGQLLKDQTLLKYLYYEDKDPLSQPDLTTEQIQKEVFNKLVNIVPRIPPHDHAKSVISLRVLSGTQNSDNSEFRNVIFVIDVFVPLSQWIIKSDNLRPFLILGQIQKDLKGKKVNGLGRIEGGDFELSLITDETIGYEQKFGIVAYE